jgi:hypothetical protein
VSARRGSVAFSPTAREYARLAAGSTVVIPGISSLPLGIETVGSASRVDPDQGPLPTANYGRWPCAHMDAPKLDVCMWVLI